ncbi:hypothetical protein OIU76_018294 [Salix suchowensis]|nr:hypothetical protein OIU76_018294 [Salix suchowensis]
MHALARGYPASCSSSISALETGNTTDPEVLFKLSLHVAMNELSKLKDYPDKLMQGIDEATLQDALKVCATVLDDAVDRFNDSISSMTAGEDALQELNATEHFNGTLFDRVKAAMENSTEFVSNSLAIAAKTLGLLSDFNIPIHRSCCGKGLLSPEISSSSTRPAGAEKHQAVAFRSGSDMSVLFRCAFHGFQDTLYAHSNRQFYRDCDITGTVDFMFGNAAVVFQNCNIQPRQPFAQPVQHHHSSGKEGSESKHRHFNPEL